MLFVVLKINTTSNPFLFFLFFIFYFFFAVVPNSTGLNQDQTF